MFSRIRPTFPTRPTFNLPTIKPHAPSASHMHNLWGALATTNKYGTLLKLARFQPARHCINHHAELLYRWCLTLGNPIDDINPYMQAILDANGWPLILLGTVLHEIPQPSEKKSKKEIEEEIRAAMLAGGIGMLIAPGIVSGNGSPSNYEGSHALLLCDLFRAGGKEYALLCDTNDQADNRFVQDARKLLPYSDEPPLHLLSPETLRTIGAHASFLRIVEFSYFMEKINTGFEDEKKKPSSWRHPLIPPTLLVPYARETGQANLSELKSPNTTLALLSDFITKHPDSIENA